jgi:broad specificity phosphatase PhoE
MSDGLLKRQLCDRIWEVVDQHPCILSATIPGSFAQSPTLEGLSDIDLVLVVDRLDRLRYDSLLQQFDAALRPLLLEAGYDLLINPTLGPLKFNEPRLAVLHLMLYSEAAHVDHVLNSPFTCLDWQNSNLSRKSSLQDVFPAFGLQPHHFLTARRGLDDYLKDFRGGHVSYRELECEADGYREVKRIKIMNERDRHEFAYHMIRFLMRNLLKLVTRSNDVPGKVDQLADAFFDVFPQGWQRSGAFFKRLYDKKLRADDVEPVPDLDAELTTFVTAFETQFRRAFYERASRHIAFRHAATPANLGDLTFQGRSDADICDPESQNWHELENAARDLAPQVAFSSPLLRCRRSLSHLSARQPLPTAKVDQRLIEIDYGECEGLTVREAKWRAPELFAAWDREEDPCFPSGENTQDVFERAHAFAAESWPWSSAPTVTCTHNVVLRTLVGHALNVPRSMWHRLRIPHLSPITFVQSERFGLFVDLSPSVEREMFRDFARRETEPCKS